MSDTQRFHLQSKEIHLGELWKEGKTKKLYKTSEEAWLFQEFKDSLTAFNAQKTGTFERKGALNCVLTQSLFSLLESVGIPTHYVSRVTDAGLVVQKLNMIPIEVVVRNYAAGSLCKRMGVPEKQHLESPLVEFFYKSDALGDPLIGETHIYWWKWATPIEVAYMVGQALKANSLFLDFFKSVGYLLADFKLEFGRNVENVILLGDEMSLDNCRLWDLETGESKDKDRFRFDYGQVKESYEEVAKRVQEALQSNWRVTL